MAISTLTIEMVAEPSDGVIFSKGSMPFGSVRSISTSPPATRFQVKTGGSVVGATVVVVLVVVEEVAAVVVAAVVVAAVVVATRVEVKVVEPDASAVTPVEPPEHAAANTAQHAAMPTALFMATRGDTDVKVQLHGVNPRSIALPRMYAFAKKPKWLAGHALFLVLLIIFVAAGFWQLSRHNSRSHRNHAVESRSSEPVVDLTEIVPIESAEDVEFRIAVAEGNFFGADIIVRSKSLDGQPGCHILTTLDTGTVAVVVNRGWVPLGVCESDAGIDIAPPDGTVAIEGRLRTSQQRGRFGATDPPDGILTTMARVDIERIQEQTDQRLASVYIEEMTPSSTQLPVRLPEPPTDVGPHLGYMVQWFSFAVVAVIGYPLLLRKQARSHYDA